ncbi:MAG: hypothetical protein WCG87_02965 [Bacteroidota bacterium]
MSFKSLSTICLLGFMSVASSCYKATSPTSSTPTPTTYTFHNVLGASVHIDLYRDTTSYKAGTGAFKSFDLTGGTSQTVALSDLPDTTYIDWYSADNLLTNWSFGLYDYKPFMPYFVKNTGNTVTWDDTYTGPSTLVRATCLGGHTSTTWKAFGGFIDSAKGNGIATIPIRQWSDTPHFTMDMRYRMITLNKDFTATYSFKDNSGNIQTRNYGYRTSYYKQSIAYVYFFNQANGAMLKDTFYTATYTDSPRPDSIQVRIDSVGVFMMARQ